jgi:hypothetical protein
MKSNIRDTTSLLTPPPIASPLGSVPFSLTYVKEKEAQAHHDQSACRASNIRVWKVKLVILHPPLVNSLHLKGSLAPPSIYTVKAFKMVVARVNEFGPSKTGSSLGFTRTITLSRFDTHPLIDAGLEKSMGICKTAFDRLGPVLDLVLRAIGSSSEESDISYCQNQ